MCLLRVCLLLGLLPLLDAVALHERHHEHHHHREQHLADEAWLVLAYFLQQTDDLNTVLGIDDCDLCFVRANDAGDVCGGAVVAVGDSGRCAVGAAAKIEADAISGLLRVGIGDREAECGVAVAAGSDADLVEGHSEAVLVLANEIADDGARGVGSRKLDRVELGFALRAVVFDRRDCDVPVALEEGGVVRAGGEPEKKNCDHFWSVKSVRTKMRYECDVYVLR